MATISGPLDEGGLRVAFVWREVSIGGHPALQLAPWSRQQLNWQKLCIYIEVGLRPCTPSGSAPPPPPPPPSSSGRHLKHQRTPERPVCILHAALLPVQLACPPTHTGVLLLPALWSNNQYSCIDGVIKLPVHICQGLGRPSDKRLCTARLLAHIQYLRQTQVAEQAGVPCLQNATVLAGARIHVELAHVGQESILVAHMTSAYKASRESIWVMNKHHLRHVRQGAVPVMDVTASFRRACILQLYVTALCLWLSLQHSCSQHECPWALHSLSVCPNSLLTHAAVLQVSLHPSIDPVSAYERCETFSDVPQHAVGLLLSCFAQFLFTGPSPKHSRRIKGELQCAVKWPARGAPDHLPLTAAARASKHAAGTARQAAPEHQWALHS